MKLGVIVQTNDATKVWNGFRLANEAVENDHDVQVFLLGDGVEAPDLEHPKVNPHGMMLKFVQNGGEVLACSSCLDSRGIKTDEENLRTRSSVSELLGIIEEADETVSVG